MEHQPCSDENAFSVELETALPSPKQESELIEAVGRVTSNVGV
jgi:hypothetical protein